MNILIVDDQQYRHQLYEKVYAGNDIYHAYTANDAIEVLKEQKFDIVQLDYDLADQHYKNLDGEHQGTGYEVAKYIEQNPGLWHMKVILHTMNPFGRSRMYAALMNCVDVQILPVSMILGSY